MLPINSQEGSSKHKKSYAEDNHNGKWEKNEEATPLCTLAPGKMKTQPKNGNFSRIPKGFSISKEIFQTLNKNNHCIHPLDGASIKKDCSIQQKEG